MRVVAVVLLWCGGGGGKGVWVGFCYVDCIDSESVRLRFEFLRVSSRFSKFFVLIDE